MHQLPVDSHCKAKKNPNMHPVQTLNQHDAEHDWMGLNGQRFMKTVPFPTAVNSTLFLFRLAWRQR